MSTYQISGKVVGKTADAQISGLRVEAWDAAHVFPRALGQAITSGDGSFTVHIDTDVLGQQVGSAIPSVYFRVVNPPRSVLEDTCGRETRPLDGTAEPVILHVGTDARATAEDGGFEVSGLARINGSFGSTIKARVYDVVASGSDTLLGSYTFGSGSDGRYLVAFDASSLVANKDAPDIKVKIVDDSTGADVLITESEVYFQAPPSLTIDITEEGFAGDNEYDVVVAATDPARSGASLVGMSASAAAILAGSGRRAEEEVEALVAAAELSDSMTTGTLSQGVLYGLVRSGRAADRVGFFSSSAAEFEQALTALSDNGTIPPMTTSEIASAKTEYIDEQVALAFDASAIPTGATCAIGDIAKVATGETETPTLATRFVQLLCEHDGTIGEFWTTVEEDTGGVASKAAELKHVVQLAALTARHKPAIDLLMADGRDLYELAMLNESELTTLLDTSSLPGTPSMSPDGVSDADYVKHIAEVLHRTHPTAYYAGYQGVGTPVRVLLTQNKSFRIGKRRVAEAFASPSNPLNLTNLDGSEQAVAKAQLEKVERLFKAVNEPAIIDKLITDNVISAHAIVQMGKAKFRRDYGGGAWFATDAEADEAYRKAQAAVADAAALGAAFNSHINQGTFEATPDYETPATSSDPYLADWTSIFGSPSQCFCGTDESVYSPAAYLVDLLQFLGKYDAQAADTSARDIILGNGSTIAGRRPDIGNIVLNGNNARTPMPYVDLVNEILEQRAADTPGNLTLAKETTLSAEELRAAPDPSHFDPVSVDAYGALADSVYPGLPYSLWHHQARVYLNHLGVSRADLILSLAEDPQDPTVVEHWANEVLGITDVERDLLTGNSSPAVADVDVVGGFATSSWEDELVKVSVFAERFDVTVDEIRELVATPYVEARGSSVAVDTVSLGDPCNYEDLRIVGLTASTIQEGFADIHRFMRLSRRLGWAFRDLGVVLEALGQPAAITDTVLNTLAVVKELVDETRRSPLEVACWYGDMSTDGIDALDVPSFFTSVFQPAGIPQETDFDDPNSLSGSYQDHFAHIAACVGTTASELELIVDTASSTVTASETELELAPVINDGDTTTISLAGLTKVYRLVSLARAAKLTVGETRSLLALANVDPFASSPTPEAFLEECERIRNHGFRVGELNYLLRHIIVPGSGIAAQVDAVTTKLNEAENQVSKAVAETTIAPSVDRESARAALERLMAVPTSGSESPSSEDVNADIEETLTLIEGRSKESFSTQSTRIGELLDAHLANASTLLPEPAHQKTGCRAWFDAEDASASSWTAVTGGFSLTGTTSGDAPEVVEEALYDRAAVSFPTTASQYATGGTAPSHTGTAHQVGFLLSCDGTGKLGGSEEAFFEMGASGGSIAIGIVDGHFAVKDATNGWLVSTAPATQGGHVLVVDFQAAGDVALRLDGVPMETLSSHYTGFQFSAGSASVVVGGGGNATQRLCKVAIAAIFNDDSQLDELEAHLLRLTGQVARERYAAVIDPITDSLRTKASTSALASALAAGVGIDLDAANALLTSGVVSAASSGAAINDFLPPPASNPEQAVASEAQKRETIARLIKVGYLAKKLQMGRKELTWLAATTTSAPTWISFDELPTGRQDEIDIGLAQAAYDGLMALADLMSLRPYFERNEGHLTSTLENAAGSTPSMNEDEFMDLLYEQTGFPREDIAFFGKQTVADDYITSHERYLIPGQLVRLFGGLELFRRLGVSASQAWGWINPNEADPRPTAEEITRTARARYDDSVWLSAIAPPLRDELRLAQRDALTAHIIGNARNSGTDPLTSKEAIYNELLIDPEMSPCQMTSRIKQAISSLQLYIQRVFLGLEASECDFGDERADAEREWEWMKNYRVWEANRKVFLHPENWVEPEWRLDKSPLFEDLESSLLRGRIDDTRVESAFRTYLDGMDTLSRLDMHGLCVDEDPRPALAPGERDLHIIARDDQGDNGEWYFRTWKNMERWTPWRPIDQSLDRTILPIAEKGRLSITTASVTDDNSKDDIKYAIPFISSYDFVDGRWIRRFSKQMPSVWVYQNSIIPPSYLTLAYYPELEAVIMSGEEFATNKPDPIENLWGAMVRDTCSKALRITPSDKDFPSDGKDSGWSAARQNRCGAPMLDQPANWDSYSTDDWGVALDYGRAVVQPRPPSSFYTPFADLWLVNNDGVLERVLQSSLEPGSRIISERVFRDYSNSPAIPEREYPVRDVLVQDHNRSFVGTRVYFPHFEDITSTTFEDADEFFVHSRVGSSSYEPDEPSAFMGPRFSNGPRYLRFRALSHPYICSFRNAIEERGLDFMRQGRDQLALQLEDNVHFYSTYQPTLVVAPPYPEDRFEFGPFEPMSSYNWELCFHAPFLLATRLMHEGRHEEATKWLHAIFNPVEASDASAQGVSRFWRLKPFYENQDLSSVQSGLASQHEETGQPRYLISQALGSSEAQEAELGLGAQLAAWRDEPFDPHLIASMRPVAYQKATVMRYIENLIEWGDKLFRRDSIESINEATQLYMLAKAILGPRPDLFTRDGSAEEKTYNGLRTEGAFSGADNIFVKAESLITSGQGANTGTTSTAAPILVPYFCFPPNEKLMGMWDLVEDRLFKIHNCLNIEGVERQLPLYEPEIDPALLIEANINGLPFSSVLDDLAAPNPVYRFSVLLPKAMEFAQTVTSFGSTLLSLFEREDGEALSRLRQKQEVGLLSYIEGTRRRQVDEARHALSALENARLSVLERVEFYAERTEKTNDWENTAQATLESARERHEWAMRSRQGAIPAGVLPDWTKKTDGGPEWTVGGSFATQSLQALAGSFSDEAAILSVESSAAQASASYERRWEQWKLDEAIAKADLAQVERQIEAAKVRITIAERELEALRKQKENAAEVERFLKDKFSRQQIYGWLREQLSTTYYQAYKFAYELAKSAQLAFRFERAEPTASFVKYGHWDDRVEGLMAGEQLMLELREMEHAFLKDNRRELEITKHISFAEKFPLQLIELVQRGETTIDIPETMFDRDYPGHYLRRLKSAAITIPAVTGPHSSINCTLTLLSSKTRVSSKLTGGDYAETVDDDRFHHNFGAVTSVCTSSAQGDSGMFELNFRDERYLPFEGAGAVSRWRIELSQDSNDFDVSTISDVVLHLNYMARIAGGLKAAAKQNLLDTAPRTGLRLFSLRHEFSAAWTKMVEQEEDMVVDFSNKVPFIGGSGEVKVTGLSVAARFKDDNNRQPINVDVTIPSASSASTFAAPPSPSTVTVLDSNDVEEALTSWTFSPDATRSDELEDILVIATVERV